MRNLYFSLLVVFCLCSTAWGGAKWLVFDIQGKAELQGRGGKETLSREKHLLREVALDSRIAVHGKGKVVLVSSATSQAFEILDDTEAQVLSTEVKARKGTVRVKKGFSTPQKGAGVIGGTVMRGGEKRGSLKIISPTNTALQQLSPVLAWKDDRGKARKVTVTLFVDEQVLLSRETAESSLALPAGTLQPGRRYVWLVNGGSEGDMSAGTFTTLTREEADEVAERVARSHGSEDLAERLSLVFYLQEKGLNEQAAAESSALAGRYPDAAGISLLIR